MSEKSKKEKEIPYPEEYSYIRDIVTPYREDIWRINAQIEILPTEEAKKPPRPSLNYVPRGYIQSRPTPESVLRQRLEQQRDQREADLYKRIGFELDNVEPDVAKSILESVQNDVHRNPYEDMSPVEFDKHSHQPKVMQHSQDYMRVLLKNSKGRKVTEVKEVTPDQKIDEPSLDDPLNSASERFIQRLGYVRAARERSQEKAVGTPSREQDLDRE